MAALLTNGCNDEKKTVETNDITVWMDGHPVMNTNDEWAPTDFLYPKLKFGLRSDGTVVWKKVEGASGDNK